MEYLSNTGRERLGDVLLGMISDEPQSVDNTAKAKTAIRSLNLLFVLRYSVTHKELYNKIYHLTSGDAFERDLVKGICVDSVTSEEDLNGAYVRLGLRNAKSNSIKLTIDVRQKDGTQKRKAVTAKAGSSLYDLSNENSDYEAGWIVSNFSISEDEEFVEFQNGEVLEIGAAVGNVADTEVKRAQIQRTIEDHFQCQFELYLCRIKVLSLFFIDQVERYRVYEPEEHGGLYAEMFEQEYADVLRSRAAFSARKACGLPPSASWKECFERIGCAVEQEPSAVHDGYFSKDGKGRLKPNNGSKSAYNYVVFDSAGIERSYAKALNAQDEVLVYAKLPSKFKIDTPLGTYNPDWAYVEEVDGERCVYFATETKGGKNGEPALHDTERMKIKCAQEHFATLELGNDFICDVKTTYEAMSL